MTRRRIPEPQHVDKDTYRIRWEGAPDPDTGKRRQHSRTVHGSLQDAQRALMDELLRAGRSDEVDLTGALTLRDYWEREYSRDIQRLAPKTVDDYTSDWERLVGPLFGEVDMRSASRRAIRRMLLDVQPPGRQRHAYKLLRQMFNAAYFDELIDQNPMQGRMKLDRVPKREPEAYTLQEATQVLEAVRGHWLEPFVIMGLCAGLRREESCGLKWEDFRFEVEDTTSGKRIAAYVRVERTAQLIKGKVVVGATKTERSTRTVVVTGYAAQRLKECRSERAGWLNERSGECGDPERVMRAWKRFCAKSSLRYVPLKGLRTSYSTIQAQLGTPDTVVSQVMGHSQLSTRYSHYLGAGGDAAKGAADALGRALGA